MKEYYKEKLIEYKNHFFTIGEYGMATELRKLEVLQYLDSTWIVWKEENFLTEIKKFCKTYKQDWILRDLKIDSISR
jgi:hypothetical protein